MSHIDKGALHAYLDGALDEYPAAEAARIRDHLDACGECADMLAAERLVRSDASTILSYASPDVELPTLEELRAYVKATRPAPRASAVRMYRMGWAASVVLAVSAGWMARDGQLQQVRLNSDFESVAETEAMPVAGVPMESADLERARNDDLRSASDQGAGQGAVGAVADRDRTERPTEQKVAAPMASPPPAAGVLGEQDLLSAVVMDGDVVGRSEAFVADNGPAEPGRAAGGGAELAEEVDDVLEDPQTAQEVLPPEATAELMAELTVGQDVPVDVVASALVLDQVLDSGVTEAEAADPDEVEAKEEQPERRSAESLVPVTSAFASGARSARQDEFVDERNFEVEPALAVPGYEVLSVTNLGEGSTPIGVQVVQRIEGDVTVELFRLLPGVDPGVLPRLGDGRNELRAETPGGVIVIRGPLTELQLNVLMVSLFPN